MNPFEEIKAMQKMAFLSFKDMGTHTGNAFAQGLGSGVGTAVLTAGQQAVGAIYNAATAKRDYREMMGWNPDLAHEDQKMVQQSFRTLRSFAPDFAKDPLISGSIVRRMAQAPQGAAGIISEVVAGHKNIARPVQDAFIAGATHGVNKGMMDFQPLGWNKSPKHEQAMQDLKDKHQKAVADMLAEHGSQMGGLQGEVAGLRGDLADLDTAHLSYRDMAHRKGQQAAKLQENLEEHARTLADTRVQLGQVQQMYNDAMRARGGGKGGGKGKGGRP